MRPDVHLLVCLSTLVSLLILQYFTSRGRQRDEAGVYSHLAITHHSLWKLPDAGLIINQYFINQKFTILIKRNKIIKYMAF